MALPIVKLAQRSVAIYPDEQVSAEVESAAAAVDAAKAASKTENSKAVTAAERALREVTSAASATVIEVIIEKMNTKAWNEFEVKHPPRSGDQVDKNYRINWDTFVASYLAERVTDVRYRDSGERVDVDRSEWAPWVATLGDPEYQKLGLAILELNRALADHPF